jgi:hypothetical protein
VPRVPPANDATSFADLHRRLDATIAYLRGRQFLVAFAIPHFFYHVTTAYGILRNQGVQLTMGDFLGSWTTS